MAADAGEHDEVLAWAAAKWFGGLRGACRHVDGDRVEWHSRAERCPPTANGTADATALPIADRVVGPVDDPVGTRGGDRLPVRADR